MVAIHRLDHTLSLLVQITSTGKAAGPVYGS